MRLEEHGLGSAVDWLRAQSPWIMLVSRNAHSTVRDYESVRQHHS